MSCVQMRDNGMLRFGSVMLSYSGKFSRQEHLLDAASPICKYLECIVHVALLLEVIEE